MSTDEDASARPVGRKSAEEDGDLSSIDRGQQGLVTADCARLPHPKGEPFGREMYA